MDGVPARFQPFQHIVVCERVDFHARAEFRYLRLNTLYFRRDWTISSRKGPSFPTPLWALVYAKGYFLSSRNQLENVSQRKRREIMVLSLLGIWSLRILVVGICKVCIFVPDNSNYFL